MGTETRHCGQRAIGRGGCPNSQRPSRHTGVKRRPENAKILS